MILHGDCLTRMREMKDSSVDAVITDPPYGLKFMGKKWDYDVPSPDIWREALRVLKPGGHLLSFGGTRTYHRMVLAIEDAGFEIRDQIMWLYGQGFPKSLDVHKALTKVNSICVCKESTSHSKYDLRPLRDAHLQTPINAKDQSGEILQSSLPEHGAQGSMLRSQSVEGASGQEESVMEGRCHVQADEGQLHRSKICEMPEGMVSDGSQGRVCNGASPQDGDENGPVSHSNGSGASQGPQHSQQSSIQSGIFPEQFSAQTCRSCGKPRIEKGIGTALKPANEPIVLARKPLDACTIAENVLKWGVGGLNIDASRIGTAADMNPSDFDDTKRKSPKFSGKFNNGEIGEYRNRIGEIPNGRWPANVILSCACDTEIHDANCAVHLLDEQSGVSKSVGGTKSLKQNQGSRFFYCAKSSKRERNHGCEGMAEVSKSHLASKDGGGGGWSKDAHKNPNLPRANHHPTVKPIKLMEYLIKLICPIGGTVLDPFCGSGSTGVAARKLGYEFIGIEMDETYCEIANKRIEAAL